MIKSFLQSKDWADFQEAFGRKVFWIGDKLIVKFDLPLGKSWLYCPRADMKIKNQKSRPKADQPRAGKIKNKEEDLFIKELSELAKKENAIFAKIEPRTIPSCLLNSIQSRRNVICGAQPNLYYLKQFNNVTIQQSNCLQPQDELLLDLSQSEREIVENMHSKTRYNLRLAQKKEVIIKKSSNSVKDIDIFYTLALQTSDRNKFRYHSKKYYQKMMEVLGKSKNVKVELLIAYLPSQLLANSYKLQATSSIIPIAAIIMLYTKDTGIYLHGASDHKFRQTMAPYLLQWEGIHRAKKYGCKWYNFGGIAPEDQKLKIKNQSDNPKLKNCKLNENCKPASPAGGLKIENYQLMADYPWSGITRFKLGFAPEGKFLHYPDCYDIVYQSGWYWIYKIIKKFK